mgnify:FL=1
MNEKTLEPDNKDPQNTIKSKKNEKHSSDTKKKTNYEFVIDELKTKLKEAEDKLLRSLAENDNLRKRHQKEIDDSFKYAIKNFSEALLTVSDNFQRAQESIPKEDFEKNTIVKNLVVGIQAVEKDLNDVFEKNGIKLLKTLNEKFNPEYHHAVSKINSDKPDGVIVEELQRGYTIGERLLRPAMVVVSMGPLKKK